MSKRKIIKIILTVVLLLRFFLPFLIFSKPLLALFLSLILDSIDGQLFYFLKFRWDQYNTVDKLLDFWWYLFIVFFFWGKTTFPIAVILFTYRSIGQFYGILAKREEVYLFFPNILEWFFFATLIFSKAPIILLLAISILWSLFVEWLIHKSNAHILSRYLFHDEILWKDKRKLTSEKLPT